MKTKTIRRILRGKFNKWLKSIANDYTRDLAEKNTIITGGSIASMLLGEPVNDYDLYFKDNATAKIVAEYYVDKYFEVGGDKAKVTVEVDPYVWVKVKSDGVLKLTKKRVDKAHKEGHSFVPRFITSNAITLSGDAQVITRFTGDAEEIHKNFDFAHCTNYWDSETGELVTNTNALESLLSKELRYIGSLYPICSMFRLRKFINRGWSINGGQILKMAFQVNDLDLRNPLVLKDQLVGVDTTYFMLFLDKLEKHRKSELPGWEPTTEFLTELLDEVFDG